MFLSNFLTQRKCFTTSSYCGTLNFQAKLSILKITSAKLNRHLSSKCDGVYMEYIKESTWPHFWFQAENVKTINSTIFINQETLHDFADKQLTSTFRTVYYSIPLFQDGFFCHWWTQ